MTLVELALQPPFTQRVMPSSRLAPRISTMVRILIAIAFVMCLCGELHACPTCKDGVAADPNSAGVVQGYFWSILFMMSMPFVILSSLGVYFYFQVRRARVENPPAPLPEARPLPADLTADWT